MYRYSHLGEIENGINFLKNISSDIFELKTILNT